jgi:hypothetical protein
MRNMRKIIFISFLILWFSTESFCQTDLIVLPHIKLPKDSTISKNLIVGLTDFLNNTEADNPYIASNNKALTLDLIDEIIGIRKSDEYKSDHFYKPYLINLTQLSDTNYFIQLSYIGTDSGVPILKANFDFLAYLDNSNKFTFSSPLFWNTSTWKQKEINGFIFHYKNVLDSSAVDNYAKKITLFDSKLGNQPGKIEFYCCSNASEALRILGVAYKSDYNGSNYISLN